MNLLRQLAAGALLALTPFPAAAADTETVRGRVTTTDPAANRVGVRTTAGRDLVLAVTPGSRLTVGGKPVGLAELKAGHRVRVTYREADGAKELVALRPAVTTDADLKREVSEALAATRDYTHRRKDEYAERVRGVLDDLDDRIEALREEAAEAGADAKRRLEPRIAELKAKRAALDDRLGKVRAASAEAWDDVKEGFGDAARDLEQWLDDDR